MNYHEVSSSPEINYRKSGLTLFCIVAIIYAALLLRGKHQPVTGILALTLLVLTIIDARLLRRIVVMLISMGNIMHRFTNPMLFGLIYLFGVVPTALFLKIIKKDVLCLKFDENAVTYWKSNIAGKCHPESFRNQF